MSFAANLASVVAFTLETRKALSVLKAVYLSNGGVRAVKTERSEVVAWMRQVSPLRCERPLIRLGPDTDGGYLIPDALDGIEACFSPGVSSVSGFEKSCARRGMQVFMADKSVEKPAEEDELFRFTPSFIGATSDEDFITLDHWVATSLPDSRESDLLLQMDIEGHEYEVLLATSAELMQRFRIIVIEFHALDQFFYLPFYKIASRAFARLLQTHACVHIHPNNCCGAVKEHGLKIPKVMEFTFLRRDCLGNCAPRRDFPHPLDVKNVADRRDIVLPWCWYEK